MGNGDLESRRVRDRRHDWGDGWEDKTERGGERKNT